MKPPRNGSKASVALAGMMLLFALCVEASASWCLCTGTWGPRIALANNTSSQKFVALSRPFRTPRPEDCGFNSDASPYAERFFVTVKRLYGHNSAVMCSSYGGMSMAHARYDSMRNQALRNATYGLVLHDVDMKP